MGETHPLLLLLGWILSVAVAAISSVGLWNYLSRREDRRVEREGRDSDRLRSDHKDCLERVERLEGELKTVLRRLEVFEAHHTSLVARWIKGAGKRVEWVNGQAMATIFGPIGYTRSQVEGRTFQDLLDVEAAIEIDRLDAAALAQPGVAVSSMLALHQRLPVMMIVKVAGIGRDQELIYEGLAIRIEDPVRVLERALGREEEQSGLSQLRLEHREAEKDKAGTPPA